MLEKTFKFRPCGETIDLVPIRYVYPNIVCCWIYGRPRTHPENYTFYNISNIKNMKIDMFTFSQKEIDSNHPFYQQKMIARNGCVHRKVQLYAHLIKEDLYICRLTTMNENWCRAYRVVRAADLYPSGKDEDSLEAKTKQVVKVEIPELPQGYEDHEWRVQLTLVKKSK
jgi:hypothetical protein